MGKMVKTFSYIKKGFLGLLITLLILIISSCTSYLDTETKDRIVPKINIPNHTYAVASLEEPIFMEEGVPKNKAIVISFSLPMDPSVFMENLNITDSLGNNLKQFFLEPEWSNENQLVKIPVNEQNLIDLNGKKSMDIYITLSKSFKTPDNISLQTSIEHKYRINDNMDSFPPNLYSVKASLPNEYINKKSISEPLLLIEGEIDLENEEEIITTNHINSKIDIYIEGNDYGGGQISAQIIYKHIYDAAGNEVFEDENSFVEKLEDINSYGNYFGNLCLDLSGDEYSDGMYKIIANVVDSSNLDSLDSKVYYIIRDTSLAYSANAHIWFETPAFIENKVDDDNEENETDTTFSSFNSQTPTLENIELFRNRIQFNYVSDDVYYVSKEGNQTVYSEPVQDFTYLISWGPQPDFLTSPVIIEGEIEKDPLLTASENGVRIFKLPQDFTNYCTLHEDEDIYIQAIVIDQVGNENIITTVIPKKIELYNYEVTDSSEEGMKTVKFNFSDMSGEITNISELSDKQIKSTYRLFYGKIKEKIVNAESSEDQEITDEIEEEQPLEELSESDLVILPLKRNAVSFESDSYDELTDSAVLQVEDNSIYVVYIQPINNIISMINGQECGQTFGPVYRIFVDSNIITEETLEIPEFEISKESAGINTGRFKVNVKINNLQDDVRYVPCYSTDGINWLYYNSESESDFSFTVSNPLKAPIGCDEAWDNEEWADSSYFDAIKAQGKASYGTVSASVKILAIKDNESKESDVKELVFTQDDDNIPPTQNNVNTRQHDSMLSFDGHSFKYENLIIEDEGHALQKFTYYYMPYNDAWGSNLSILNAEQIEALPNAQSSLDSYVYRQNGAKYSLNPVIPINGLKDGKYMFFAKVMDSYGNYNYITLGKANVGTFKNKLTVQYDSKKQSFISRLNIEPGEKFDRNMINIQQWNNNAHVWDNLYGAQNELQNCERIETNERVTLYNKTKRQIKRFENGFDVSYSQDIIPQCFYRLTVQGFNENSYNPESGQGVNIRYGRPYNNNVAKESIVDRIDGETEYDLCTEETVSNTVYYYVPAENEDFKNFSAKFFVSTAAPRSNKPYIVNVISSLRDLGKDVDEWERRGKLIKTHYYNPLTDQNNPDYPFNDGTALDDMSASGESGLVYYVAVVHYADNSTAISNVYKYQGF